VITKVVLAKLSPTMEEGTIVKWSKNEGDAVKIGDVLAEIETDKANMEMEAMTAGILRKILVPAGGKAPVGSLIGVIADANEDIAAMVASAAAPPAPSPTPAAAPAASGAAPAPAALPQAAPPVAETPATVPPPQAAAPPSPAAPRVERAPGEKVKASPLARAMAAERSLPLQSIAGTGPGGRITKRDVESYVSAPRPRPGAAVAGGAPASAGSVKPAPRPPQATITPGTAIAHTNMRKTIARRLSESAFTAVHFYVTVEIDMDAAVSLREQLARAQDVKLAYDALIVRACALGLRSFPMVNATWSDEQIVTHANADIGVAVSLPDGLITPVIREADTKSVLEISAEIRALAGKARDKKLKPEDYTGATFTVSNLGMYDVSEFTAIINPPGSAILAIGGIRRVPVVDGDAIRPGHRMKITLSSDHRVIDGALAADFLREVRRLLENPISLFV
jgi:pyruvate dehydrogenase E2 component (dihydrolipoamide acetyltransferase)